MYDWAEFRHFRYLLKILEKGGFRIAAEELHTSQPNLTVQARQFQEQASIRLFRRLKNGQIRPTETGIAFISLARMILEIREEAIETLISIEKGEVSLVRFGSTPLVDPMLLRRLCALHKDMLPGCPIRPTHGDAVQLAQEVAEGIIDVAVVTLPLANPDLCVEEIRRDRLVVCLRKDHPLAGKPALQTAELQGNLAVLYHPIHHPAAHLRLMEMLSEVGVTIKEYSRASHPSELQALVKDGYGLALIREGILLDEGLTTRPLVDVDWTVDTVVIYHRRRHPKTVPIIVRELKRSLQKQWPQKNSSVEVQSINSTKRPVQSVREPAVQLSLYRDSL